MGYGYEEYSEMGFDDLSDDDEFEDSTEEKVENCGMATPDERANFGVGCLRAAEEYCTFVCPFNSLVYPDTDTE